MKNENRKAITYIILSIIMLIVIVALFTYAYFDGNIDTDNYLELNVTVAEGVSAEFAATGQNDITVEVSGEKMLMDGVGAATGSGETSIDITLESPMDVFCTYDLYWVWDSDSPNAYTKTNSPENEFTIAGTNGTNSLVETQLPNSTTELKLGTYSIETKKSTTNQSWNFIAKFYNINANQDAHADKTYKGLIEVRNGVCGAISESNTISNNVLALANGTERTSSQDGTPYIVKRETVEYNGTPYDAGVRYEGNDPDNYVTFNGNEEWRIIGVFEGSTIGLEPGKQYTKIIKSASIGNMAWNECTNFDEEEWTCVDVAVENDWANSTLNAYLNSEYLQSLTDANKIAKYNGDYSTWYLRGLSNYGESYTPDWYIAERITGIPGYKNNVQYGADPITTGAIGIMYPSDYGYGAYGSSCDNKTSMTLSVYNEGCAEVDWLLLEGNWEWLISPYLYYSNNAFTVAGFADGSVDPCDDIYTEIAVRPVLYLEASVMIDTGEGTKANPYKLG